MSREFILPSSMKAFRPSTPRLQPGAFESFDIRPYWRQASCAEVECEGHTQGWTTVLNETVPQQAQLAAYIRARAGRRFTESRTDAGWTQFEFPPGQACFQADQHRVQADRPELYLRQGGDWRKRVGPVRRYDRADQWADDFHARTDQLATVRSRAGTAGP